MKARLLPENAHVIWNVSKKEWILLTGTTGLHCMVLSLCAIPVYLVI